MMQIRGILLSTAAAVPLLVVASPLAAQSLTLDPPPVRLPLDENGVDLSTGAISVPSSTVAIGGAQGLQHTRFRVTNGWRHNYVITIAAGVVSGTSDQTREIDIGGSRVVFVKSGALYNPLYGDTGSLTEDSTSYTYTAGDGTVYNFSKSLVANGESYYGPVAGLATSIVSPGGAKTTLTYRNASYSVSGLTIYVVRLESVNNNAGYQLKYTYGANAPSSSNVDAWYRITRVTAINNAVQYCNPTIITANCNLTSNWPYLDYTVTTSGTDTLESVTDILGREARFRTDASSRLTGIKRPSEAADGVTITYNSSSKVSSITAPEGYSRTYAWATDPGGLLTSISNDALGRQRTVVTNTDQSVIESDTDALGHTTSYEYDAYGRVTAIVAPEGGRTEITRDARGRVTLVRRKAKPGTGLADITTSATYPALVSGTGYMMYCANGVTCDSPLTTTDARGKVTNYTYDQSTGALTEAKLPADSAGVRPATRYTYSARYARYLNSGGAVAQAATPIAVLDSVSTCRVGASCTGTADERVTEFTYPSGTGVSNLQPVSVTARSGDNSLTATSGLTYDAQGNQVTIDGPLAGSDDLVMRRYDAAGQLVGVVGPDPDGTGALPHLATRLTYNSDGQVKTKEVGSVTGLGDTEWAAFAPAMKYVTGYDAAGRVATNAQVHTSSSIQYNLTQYSYDVAGRPECAALRMNAPATTTVLPASACTPMTAGSYGEDRISRNYYDAADRVTETWSGIGTSLAQKTTKFAYTADGQVDWVEDAKGNRTGFTYDGFDRGTKVTYPSKTTPNTVNAADYEQVTYDAAGNVLTHRSRAGETFTFAYDNLGRVTSKDVPARSGLSSTHTRDVYYGYDLFGALTYARFDSATGEGLGFTYNALGQLTSSIQSLDGITRTLGYQYDAAGRRTRITFPDAAYWQYQYDKLGRFTNLKDQLNRDLVLDAYYNFGIRYSHKREGSAPDDTYYLDFAKRLTRTFTDHPTAGYDVNQEWAYNPANQAVTESLDNQLFVWTGHPLNTSEVAYTSNGLNQIASANSNAFTYDANGNLTFDGLTSFTYDTENRLVASSGQNNVALRYDPFGRLYEIDDGQGGVRRLLYDGDALVAEYNTAGTMLDRYIHGVGAGDDPLLRYPGSSTSYLDAEYMVTDRLGSVIARYKRDGTAVAINSYDEYGVPGPVSGIKNNGRFRYTGQIWLPELGQYYYKARMYSPTLGRFMQTDPIGYADGMNIYRYVGNDPVNALDPSGLLASVHSNQGNENSGAGFVWTGPKCPSHADTNGRCFDGYDEFGQGNNDLGDDDYNEGRGSEKPDEPQNDRPCPVPSGNPGNVSLTGTLTGIADVMGGFKFTGTLTDTRPGGMSVSFEATGVAVGFAGGSYDVQGTVPGFDALDATFQISFFNAGYYGFGKGGARISRDDLGPNGAIGEISVSNGLFAPLPAGAATMKFSGGVRRALTGNRFGC